MWEEMQEPLANAWEHGKHFIGAAAVVGLLVWNWVCQRLAMPAAPVEFKVEEMPVLSLEAQEVIGHITFNGEKLDESTVKYGCVTADIQGCVTIVKEPVKGVIQPNTKEEVKYKDHEHAAIGQVVRARLAEIEQARLAHLRDVASSGVWCEQDPV